MERSAEYFGRNVITKEKRISFWKRFLQNLGDPIIRILIGAMVINIIFMFRDINIPETVGIASAVFIAAFVSALSEHGSEAAFEKLNEEASRSVCFVTRNAKRLEIAQSELLCGDVITIASGDVIPADCTLVSGELTVSQAPLTGESEDIKKRATRSFSYFTVTQDMELSLSGESLVFKGCLCTKGEAVAVVCRVGEDTFYGEVAKDVQKGTRPSPLKTKLSALARSISFLGYFAAFLIMCAYLFNAFVIDSSFDKAQIVEKLTNAPFVASSLISAVTLGVSVIVVAVPEGLPMMICVVLSSNMKKMLKDGVLVRKMVGIETAGSMNILFCDKTGTLTSGKMTLSKIICPFGEYYSAASLGRTFSPFLSLMSSSLVGEGRKTPTEKAVIDFCKGFQGVKTDTLKKLPFNSQNKYSACLSSFGKGRMCVVMGAAEKLLSRCSEYITEAGQKKLLDSAVRSKMAQKLFDEASSRSRVMALITAPEGEWDNVCHDSFDGGCLVLLMSLRDELRREVKPSVATAQEAGVQVVMITGDNKETARAVARAAGIYNSRFNTVLTGEELRRLDDSSVLRLLPTLAVVARALPSDKLRLVKLAERQGLVSGMTGDGVNDAPSLKAADVGFAMGSGAEVSKEASDIILVGNSFQSITNAILYGRTVFRSIRKFIVFQLTMNFCALGVSLIGPFIGYDAPITVIQMLWVNIIMDTLGGLAFAGEAPLKRYMKSPPSRRDEKILTRRMVLQILFDGTFALALCLFFLESPIIHELFIGDRTYFMTCFFALFIFCSMFISFTSRAPTGHLLSNISGNKAFISIIALVVTVQTTIIYFGGQVFRCVPLSARDLGICALLSFLVIPVDFLRKLIFNKKQK